MTLADYGVRAELTATPRVGVHRYGFPAGRPAHVLLDLRHVIYDYPGKVLWSQLRIRPDGAVTGMRETRGWAPGRKLYFALRFSAAPTSHALYDREPVEQPYKGFAGPGTGPRDIPFIQGRGLVAVFDFGALSAPLVVKVALSPTSEAAALANLAAEAPDFDFDAVRARARQAWETELGRVRFDAPAPMRRNLYTALYHSLLAPSLFMDVDGGYRGPDGETHQANGFDFVSSFSLWDTYRAEQPLMTLIQPDRRTADAMTSLIVSREESPYGILPVWQFAGLETWCMIGYHAVPELADAILKDQPGVDPNRALDAMVASADYGPYGHLAEYMRRGYVPVDLDGEGVSKTLEYAFDDWTIAQAARKLGRTDIADRFTKRAGNWRNVFDPKTGFTRPRLSDGAWREPFDPAAAGAGSGFTEGNAWQYSEYAPQDIGGLITAMGGDAALVAKLDATFDQKVDPRGLRPRGGYGRADRPVRARQRAQPPHGLSLRLRRGALAHPGAAEADRGQPVPAGARRPGRQRRPRPDVGLADLHSARLLSGGAGLQRLRHRPPLRGLRRGAAAQRQAVRGEGGWPVRRPPLCRRGKAERPPAEPQLHHPRRDHGRRRAALHHAGDAEHRLGDGAPGAACVHVAVSAVRGAAGILPFHIFVAHMFHSRPECARLRLA